MQMKLKKKSSNFWLPILSGIFIGTSYIPFPPWAILFAYVPLWIWWSQQERWSKVWWGGWLTQFTLNLIGFNWVTYTIHEFGHLNWFISVLGFLLYCGFSSLHIPLAGLLWFFLKRHLKPNSKLEITLLPATAILCELLYPMIFTWHLGYTLLWQGWPIFNLAEFVGFQGLSSLIFIFNALIFLIAVTAQQKSKIVTGFRFLGIFFIFLSLNLWGHWLQKRLPQPDRSARILNVQANIGNTDKIYEQYRDQFLNIVLERYLSITDKGLNQNGNHPPIDFILWPESAYPHFLDPPTLNSTQPGIKLRDYLRQQQIHLITGAYSRDPQARQIMVSMAFLGANGYGIDSPYGKSKLLVFGEYIPGIKYFPFIKKFLPEIGEFLPGSGPQIKTVRGLKIGPQICYESLFDEVSRSLAQKGAQILVNITNDSWYGSWQEPYQHLYMTLARAIEVRKPLIRATNTGISSAILANGQILTQSPLNQEWFFIYDVPYSSHSSPTIFMSWGFYFSWFIVVFIFILNSIYFLFKKKQTNINYLYKT
ncbi:MAG: apolipoprotein N-acyltransferase [Bdellovibrionales bacterium]|nr:apolipoprotein N-acyltransferase [Bdellovibrionales bacterium]